MTVHDVVVPLYDDVLPLDVCGPADVFATATDELGRHGGYRLRFVAARAGAVRAAGGLRLAADGPLPRTGPIGTLLVPGGAGSRTAARDPAFVDWVRDADARATRTASVCTGAFVLAAAGLLDDRQATTHWAFTDRLACAHPRIRVHPDALYLRSGRIWTSAGVTAGVDLALALVEQDHGAGLAQAVARYLVVHLRRAGGQSQYAGPVWHRPAARPSVRAAQDLIHAEPHTDLRIPALARRVGMSPRHLSREFTRQVGTPPGEYVEEVRVNLARGLLESEPLPVAAVAARCGFGTAETLRRAFRRRVGVPPEQYRRRFALPTPPDHEEPPCRSRSRSIPA